MSSEIHKNQTWDSRRHKPPLAAITDLLSLPVVQSDFVLQKIAILLIHFRKVR